MHTQLRAGLVAPQVGRFGLGVEVLLDGVAGEIQFAGDLADVLVLYQLAAPDLADGFHA